MKGRLLPNGAETFEGPILNFNAVGRQEVGVYQCTADNGISAPATATIDLRVQCMSWIFLFAFVRANVSLSQRQTSALEYAYPCTITFDIISYHMIRIQETEI